MADYDETSNLRNYIRSEGNIITYEKDYWKKFCKNDSPKKLVPMQEITEEQVQSKQTSSIGVSVPITGDRLYYKGSYFTVGDVVSVVDDQHRVYYAQIRGLLQDQYGEKSAVLTWLLPTQTSPKDRFDPETYIIGPEEDMPRKLECLEFVSHSPSGYYKAEIPPYPTIPSKPEIGFIWTRDGPKQVRLPFDANDLSDFD